MSGKILTLQMIYKEGAEILEHAGISDAKLDAWYLLEYVTGISRASYFGDPKREVPKEQAESYREVILRRAGHIPLQHITGEQEFMGYSFLVNPQARHRNIDRRSIKVYRAWYEGSGPVYRIRVYSDQSDEKMSRTYRNRLRYIGKGVKDCQREWPQASGGSILDPK